jgi:rfaE bifunctional protein nucleotidyltransferase chain/domain
LVWDPHPRGAEPVPGTRLATPNEAEAAVLAAQAGGPGVDAAAAGATGGRGLGATASHGRALVSRWGVGGVVITLGARGALLVGADGTPLAVPAPNPPPGLAPLHDPCGAGDRFAAAAAAALGAGALPSEAVAAAVQTATGFVVAGGVGGLRALTGPLQPPTRAGSTPQARPVGAFEVAAAVRAAGGTVVATGGCFDLLHAGHVRALEAARALGDCLIVCLNSDDSVRRLKGPGRPLVSEADRASVLLGLTCVDAVEIFPDDTPIPLLERLRPDLWAKGADYALRDLPEAAVAERWGGHAVVVPYLAGRSTTRLIEEASSRDRR